MVRTVFSYLRMIKFSHSVFALPFAFTSALIAAEGVPSLWKMFWIVVAMVSARSGAMGLNRYIDRKIDADNPRTSQRELPAGTILARDALLFSLISLSAMILAAWMLNPLCLKLSPVAIAVMVGYSFTKRFTWASHFVLGLAISAAPLGAWIAVRGTFDLEILDRSRGLFSIPARFGVKASLVISRILHALTWGLLVLTGILFNVDIWYWAGVTIAAGLFIYEHSLIRAEDLRKIDMAFFNMNGYISITIFVSTLLDYLIA
jgi:4-hydroxybenzoate polyprenyltransferase